MELTLLMLLLFLFAGVYSLFTAVRLSRATELFDNFLLYPGNCKKEECLDPQGFMDYMRPRLTIFGALSLLLAAYYVTEYYLTIPKAVTIVQIIFAVGVFGWGFWVYNRAARRFW